MTPPLSDKTPSISAVDYFAAKVAYEMTPYALKRLLSDEKAAGLLVLDARSPEAYAQGHIPAAVNIPLADLPAQAASLPQEKTIVAYGATMVCGLGPKAALLLAQKGFQVMQLAGGLATWTDNGFPLEK